MAWKCLFSWASPLTPPLIALAVYPENIWVPFPLPWPFSSPFNPYELNFAAHLLQPKPVISRRLSWLRRSSGGCWMKTKWRRTNCLKEFENSQLTRANSSSSSPSSFNNNSMVITASSLSLRPTNSFNHRCILTCDIPDLSFWKIFCGTHLTNKTQKRLQFSFYGF